MDLPDTVPAVLCTDRLLRAENRPPNFESLPPLVTGYIMQGSAPKNTAASRVEDRYFMISTALRRGCSLPAAMRFAKEHQIQGAGGEAVQGIIKAAVQIAADEAAAAAEPGARAGDVAVHGA